MMKLQDMKIGTQLRIGMGAILVFVAILGATAWFQADSLWEETKGLYDHPLQMRRTIGILTSDILSMHRDMKDLVMAENENERQSVIQDIDTHAENAARQFDIMYDRYLGPRSDIDEVRHAFVQWKSIREETIRILRAGKTIEALKRTKSGGVGGSHVEKILKEVQDISDFSQNRSDRFYQEAQKRKDDLMKRLTEVFGAILLLTLGVGYLLLNGIRKPLQELTSSADLYSRGKFDARSSYASANEFGALSDSFNALAAAIQFEMQGKENTIRIADAMLGNKELMAFCEALLPGLIAGTGSHIGAVYFLREETNLFEPYYAIGLTQDKMRPFSAAVHEGEFGAVLTRKKITRTSDIPEDTIFDFASVAGNFRPREIITIPVMQFDKVIAVISLASLNSYSEAALTLINNSWKNLNIGIIGMLAFESIREYSRKLDRQNAQLAEQAQELQSQTDALRTKNEEIQAQSEEMTAQSMQVRKQAEELQEQNTELDRQRLALEEASRLKSQFLSNMSHELRTPLNSVMALSRVLMMQASTKLSTEEVNYLEIIERNGKNLLALINDILDLAKIEAGRMDVNAKPFSMRRTIEDIVESITPLAAEKRLGIYQEVPADLPLLESDEMRVSQILQNLMANAVKFTEAGSVTVAVQRDSQNISVRIADTGIGIAAHDLPYIFDEFRQVDGTSARRHEGTGLGLAIARKAARMLNGDIEVVSVLGKGSTFTLTLPLVWEGTAPACEPIVIHQPSGVKSKRKTILVVDDEPEMAAMISRYLLQEGYNTLTATSGVEALELAVREHPFAVTLDIIMPDMDGWEVLQGLKKHPETKEIPVIIVSISDDRATGFALGAVGYVTKPVAKMQLIAEIQKIGKPGARTVMIVDDNDLERNAVRRIIEEEGLKPIVAEDGAVCLELIKAQVPDVLVLDLMMPEPDGFVVLEKIRSNPATRDLPVIIVTAKDLTEEDRKKLSGNVFAVLEKSAATAAALLAEIKRILQDIENPAQHPESEKLVSPPRILLVEDNEAAIIQVKAVLESAGYAADVAKGGQEAFDYIARTIPDGVILDLMMPEIDGFAVLERIRGGAATANIPVLILTAKDLTPDDLRKLSANHIQQLVQKGDIDRDSLLSKVRSMLGISELQAWLYDGGRRTDVPDFPRGNDDFDSYSKRSNILAGALQKKAPAAEIPAILIVEDNPDNMTTMKAVLQNRYRIIEATDGEEGLQMAAEARPDLILLDIALPKMDGFIVVRHLKENSELSSIPVIAMTAQAMKGDRERIIAAGCDDYIAKPLNAEGFLKKIGEWLKS